MDNQNYKIRSTTTGKFSSGTDNPKFTKVGKSWKNIGYVNAHLSQLSAEGWQEYRKNQAEIVEYEIKETEVGTIDIDDHIKEIQRKNKELRERLEQQ